MECESPYFVDVMKRIVSDQTLIASVTSEVGTAGDTRSSVCAIEREGDTFKLEKAATTVSYGQHADALLVTARRAPDAAASDQVLVYLAKDDYSLTPTSNWETLGMRGTCSPGGQLSAQASVEQILPGAFAESSAQTMVPYSHILWSALWCGIAADAVRRAATFVRGAGARNPGVTPPAAVPLALATAELQSMHHHWIRSRDRIRRDRRPTAKTLMAIELGVEDEQPEDRLLRSGAAHRASSAADVGHDRLQE